jgi:hypothetical protein
MQFKRPFWVRFDVEDRLSLRLSFACPKWKGLVRCAWEIIAAGTAW